MEDEGAAVSEEEPVEAELFTAGTEAAGDEWCGDGSGVRVRHCGYGDAYPPGERREGEESVDDTDMSLADNRSGVDLDAVI